MLPLFSETKSIQIYRACRWKGTGGAKRLGPLATMGYPDPTSADLRKKSKSDFARSVEETKERASKLWENRVVREKNNNQKNPPQTPHSTLADVARPADLKKKRFSKGAPAWCFSSRRCRRRTRWTVGPWPKRHPPDLNR